ncbi:23S rRNA (pseudouridine(1915)-N(3))-methyltransferase RlmH [Deferribacter thermophilus]|uniref:23S rRNA (pseudouridine(1915)-N(3))-methyltransferase RlmH n=1 Tax=Deferribacter thermophilus TaxID=53573 RepID=UPI003C21D3CB
MKIRIIVGSKISDRYIRELLDRYIKRLKVFCDFEIKDFKCSGNVKKDDEKYILLSQGFYRVGLAIEGKMFDSMTFAKRFLDGNYNDISFLIGSAEGLSEDLKKDCDELLSLSKLTFCHEHALLVLTEQIYRGFTINKGHPYHK